MFEGTFTLRDVIPIASEPLMVPMQRGRLAATALAHAISDGFISFVAPLWFVVQAMYHLSDSQLGMLSLLLSLITNFGQPFFGYVIDRWRLGSVIPLALTAAVVSISVIGFAPNFWAFTAFLLVGGLGVSVFHPQAGARAMQASGSRRALGMSIFGAGGALGIAGFALAGPLLHTWGLKLGMGPLQGFVFAIPLGLLGVWIVWRMAAPPQTREAGEARFSLRTHLLPLARPLALLFGVMVLRASTVTAYSTFIQVLQGKLKLSALAQGTALCVFVVGGALGNILGGWLSDRLGRKATTIGSLLLSPPFLYFALGNNFAATVVLLFLAGITLRAAESVNISQTQDLMPQGVSTASAIAMGLTWGIAGFVAPLVGIVSDKTGDLRLALAVTAILPVLAAILAIWLPEPRRHSTRLEMV